MTDAASNLGAIAKRIDMQEDFVANLMDSIDSGIGRLVDADMSEESTRLKALQTQQQLGIQSLSIANTNSQNILSLFPGRPALVASRSLLVRRGNAL
jgi:flagellin